MIVAPSAFGMGINRPDIWSSENLCSWAQELGRAWRDGAAKPTMFYHDSHAGAWIKGKIGDFYTCERMLTEFSESRYLQCKCRRELDLW